MRRVVLIALLCAGCATAQGPEPATQETAVLIFGSGRPARACLRTAYQSIAARLPKPLSQEPEKVAARMFGGLERTAQQEKAQADAAQRRREAAFRDSLNRLDDGASVFGSGGLGGMGGL